MTLISQYVTQVKKIPSGGINRDACIYYVTLAGNEGDLVLSLSGKNLNALGNSKLKGTDGLTQALLISIYRSTDQQSIKQKICQTYSHLMNKECSLSQNWQSQDNEQDQDSEQNQGNEQDQDPNRPSPPPRSPRDQNQNIGQWQDQDNRQNPNRPPPRRSRNQDNPNAEEWQDQRNPPRRPNARNQDRPRDQEQRWRLPKTKEEWGQFEKTLKKAIKRNPKGVIGNLTRELRKDPNHPILLFYAGMAFIEEGDRQKALHALNKSCKLNYRRACQRLKKIKKRK